MSYFLKKTTPASKGLYLQIYESYYVPGKGKRNRSHMSLGYACDLVKKGIQDPVAYGQKLVDELNSSLDYMKSKTIAENPPTYNIGYFLIKAMFDKLDMEKDLSIMTSKRNVKYTMDSFIRTLVYAQVVSPGSKHRFYDDVIPTLYNCPSFSYDQILDGVNYIGQDYPKYIELLNKHINDLWPRETSKVYFDCTNYYFEIDQQTELIRKGPGKDRKHEPIVAQALMLDSNQIPISMCMFPGNQSEKPYLRSQVEEMKLRCGISGKVIQVADKGLNCAENIYAATKESHDGYIFSKSVHGHNLSEQEKAWVVKEENSAWHEVRDGKNNLKYKYKEDVGDYWYRFNHDSYDGDEIKFKVREKRIVTYNPALAKKKKEEIRREFDKVASKLPTIKASTRDELGDAAKYVRYSALDKDGKLVRIKPELNEDKYNEDLKYAGYNLLVTSETEKSAEEIYDIYHNLWRIEESFRILKSNLESRPVYVQKPETIYGHFTICYIALTLLRLLEFKTFNRELCTNEITDYIRQFEVTKTPNETYINNTTTKTVYDKIIDTLGVSSLGRLYLGAKDLKAILETEV